MQRYTILLTWPNFFFTTGFNRALRRQKKVFVSNPDPSIPTLFPPPLLSPKKHKTLKINTNTIQNNHKQLILNTQHLTKSLPTPYQLPPNSYHGGR